jgi:hypothetical protein
MKTPNPDLDPFVDPFIEALQSDLPTSDQEARVRARLLAAGILGAGAALTTSSSAAALGGSGGTSASAGLGGASATSLGGASATSLGGASATSLGGAATVSAGTAGGLGAAPAVLAKAGLLSKVLVLPLAAKVGVATTLAVAVAATSLPLLTSHRAEAPRSDAAPASVASGAKLPRAAGNARPAQPGAGGEVALLAPSQGRSGDTSNKGMSAPNAAADATGASARTSASGVPSASAASGLHAASSGIPASAASRPREPRDASGSAGSARTTSTQRARSTGSAGRVAAAPTRAATASAQPPIDSDTPRGHTATVSASTLAEETRLMERAMLALGEGDSALARGALEEHARRFPAGMLQPERERALDRLRRAEAEEQQRRTQQPAPR